jgi:hypothetical protein
MLVVEGVKVEGKVETDQANSLPVVIEDLIRHHHKRNMDTPDIQIQGNPKQVLPPPVTSLGTDKITNQEVTILATDLKRVQDMLGKIVRTIRGVRVGGINRILEIHQATRWIVGQAPVDHMETTTKEVIVATNNHLVEAILKGNQLTIIGVTTGITIDLIIVIGRTMTIEEGTSHDPHITILGEKDPGRDHCLYLRVPGRGANESDNPGRRSLLHRTALDGTEHLILRKWLSKKQKELLLEKLRLLGRI